MTSSGGDWCLGSVRHSGSFLGGCLLVAWMSQHPWSFVQMSESTGTGTGKTVASYLCGGTSWDFQEVPEHQCHSAALRAVQQKPITGIFINIHLTAVYFWIFHLEESKAKLESCLLFLCFSCYRETNLIKGSLLINCN